MLAASLRRVSGDLSLYAGFLLNALSASLPTEMMRVERRAGLFGRVRDDAPVLGVEVLCGDRRFALRRQRVGQPVTAWIRHESMERMQKEAEMLHAEGIVGAELSQNNHTWGGHTIEFFSIGTAVRPMRDNHRIPQPQLVLSLDT